MCTQATPKAQEVTSRHPGEKLVGTGGFRIKKNIYHSAGLSTHETRVLKLGYSRRQSASLHDFIFSTGMPGTVRFLFHAVEEHLAKSGEDTRL